MFSGRYSGLESRVERRKEVLLSDVGYACPHHPLDLSAICRLERAETSNIERLEDVRRVRRHAERNDVVLLAVELEVGRVVAVVAVEDEEAINPGCSSFGMLVEVLNPFQASLIGCPTVFGRRDDPVVWQWAVLVPRGEVMLALDDNERRDRPASSVDTLDHCCPLPIARLLRLCPATPFGACDNHCG